MMFAILAPAVVIVATLVVSTSAASTALVFRNGGIICQALSDRIVCSKANHTGYVVRFSDSVVIVEKAGTAKVIFSVPQYTDGVGMNKLPARGPTNVRAAHVFCEQSWVDYGGTTEYGLGCMPQRIGGYYFVMTKHVLMIVDVGTSTPVFTRRLP